MNVIPTGHRENAFVNSLRQSEALSYERRLMNSRVGDEFQDGSGPRLSELIARWFEMYGKTLSSGAERKVKLEAICSRLGDPFASQFDKNMFATYRERRLSGEWNPKGKKNLVKQPLIASSHIYMLFLPN